MQTHLKGRIIEIWTHENQVKMELLVGMNRHILTTMDCQLINQFHRGDLAIATVSATTNSQEQLILSMDRVGGPGASSWNALSDVMRWRRTLDGPSRMFRLHQRQSILTAIRLDLQSQGFLEVETPLLVRGTCPDTYIESVQTGEGYLVTSTEYQIKRLMVGGFDEVFTLTKNFREGDRGRYHSSEFTMLEWARAFGSMEEIEEDAIRLSQKAFQALYPGKDSLTYQGSEVNFMTKPWERLTVREAFQIYLGLENLHDFSLESLYEASIKAKIHLPSEFQQDQHLLLSYLLDLVQPHLGRSTPTFLREWPAFMTSSAKLSQKDPFVAERSELYITGIEIADGFPFLTDPKLQNDLFSRELRRREQEKRKQVVVDEKYVEALAQGIPPGAGMALGIDRLVMALTGANQLSDIQAFAWDEI